MKLHRQRLHETASPVRTLRVDRERGVIEGVKILGAESKNGRTYTTAAMSRAASLYEGVRVNVDHRANEHDDSHKSSRRVADRFGVLKNVRESDGGLYADLHYLKAHPLAEMTAEMAERMPETVGMSHVADGKIRRERGRAVVEEITRVFSVDLVSDPATTRGLFESESPMNKHVKQVLTEAFSKPEHKATLAEMDDAMLAAAPVDAGTGDPVSEAFKSMVLAVLDDESLDAAGKLAKIKEILKAQDKLTAEPEKKESGESGGAAESVAAQQLAKLAESVESLAADHKARTLLADAGLLPTSKRLAALSLAKDDAARAALVETWHDDPPPAAPRPGQVGRKHGGEPQVAFSSRYKQIFEKQAAAN